MPDIHWRRFTNGKSDVFSDGAFAEFKRSLIHERQLKGIALAKLRGTYRGRAIHFPLNNRLMFDGQQQRVSKMPCLLANQVLAVTRCIKI